MTSEQQHIRKLEIELQCMTNVVNAVAQPLLVLDEQMQVLMGNRAFYRTFQIPLNVAAGRCLDEEEQGKWNNPKLRALLDEILANAGELIRVQMGHRSMRLGERTVVVSGRRLHGDGKKMLLSIEDITERKEVEEDLRRKEGHFRDLTEDIPQLVWSCDPEGQCDYVSPQWNAYTGLPVAEQLGRGWVDAVHEEDRPRMHELWKASSEKGQQFTLEYRLRNAEGEYRWFKAAALPIRNAEGTVIKWFGTSTDIHDQKNYAAHLERTVEERTAKLRETVRELEAFSYSIAHDMRAPLRAIQNFACLLVTKLDLRPQPEAVEYAERIHAAAARLDRLIQDVLSYSRIIQGLVPMESVNVDKLIPELISTEPAWQPPRAHVTVEGTLPPVWGNEAYLTQAISNILNNAVKFVAKGTHPKVRIWAETLEGKVRIWFQDNGIGINREDQERIFNLLDRIHPETEYAGTGLGLAIARKACERMKGTIAVESEPDQGSRFCILLRAAKPTRPDPEGSEASRGRKRLRRY